MDGWNKDMLWVAVAAAGNVPSAIVLSAGYSTTAIIMGLIVHVFLCCLPFENPAILAGVVAISWYQVLIIMTVKQQQLKGTYVTFHTNKPIKSLWLTLQRVLQLQDVRTNRPWSSLSTSEQADYRLQLLYFALSAGLVLRLSFGMLFETGVSYIELACHIGLDEYDDRLMQLCASPPAASWLQDVLTSTMTLSSLAAAELTIGLWYVAYIAAFVGLMLAMDVVSRTFYLLFGVVKIPLLDNPWYSTTLAEFWGQRWNTTVQPVLKACFFDPAVKDRKLPLVAGVFLAFAGSGYLHAMPMWVAGARWLDGLAMFGFFILNAVAVLLDLGLREMGVPFLISYSTAWLALLGFLPVVIHCMYMAWYEAIVTTP
eukprot:m.130831 g.130831  ORF g.130831 m.130831 type:complete len:370 (+) comp15893_c0_seq1:92-1201(+)